MRSTRYRSECSSLHEPEPRAPFEVIHILENEFRSCLTVRGGNLKHQALAPSLQEKNGLLVSCKDAGIV